MISHRVGDKPRPGRTVGSARSTPTRSSAAPRTRACRDPSAESTAPTTSSCGRSSTGASAIRRARMRICDHEHDLAREDPTPREVGRAEAADERADRDGHGSGGGHEPVRRRPSLGRGSSTPPARRWRAGSAPRRSPRGSDHPNRSTGRLLCERGGQRAAPRRSRSRSRRRASRPMIAPTFAPVIISAAITSVYGRDRALDAGHRRADILRRRSRSRRS